MPAVLYEASPSMVRINPLGTVIAILVLIGGLVVAAAKDIIAASVGQPEQGMIVGIVGIVLVGLAFLRLVSWYIATKMDHLVIKEDEIIWSHGLLNKQTTEINMSAVRTVRVNQTLLQRIMGAGDITIFSAGDNPEVVIKGMPDPDAIRAHIKGEARDERKVENNTQEKGA